MHVVGCGSATTRSDIEHHQFGVNSQQTVHLFVFTHDSLRLMLRGNDGKVLRKDRERIDQHLHDSLSIIVAYDMLDLFLRSVFLAEEARALCQCGFIYFSPC